MIKPCGVVLSSKSLPSKASEQLSGKAIHWVAWDPSHVLTALLRRLLNESIAATQPQCRLRLSPLSDITDLGNHTNLLEQASLATFVVRESESFLPVAEAISTARRVGGQSIICLCYAPEPIWSLHAADLLQVGAQIVIHELTSLKQISKQLATRLPVSEHGYHPLTSGLLDRLPWSDR